jgi:hypothetical protein
LEDATEKGHSKEIGQPDREKRKSKQRFAVTEMGKIWEDKVLGEDGQALQDGSPFSLCCHHRKWRDSINSSLDNKAPDYNGSCQDLRKKLHDKVPRASLAFIIPETLMAVGPDVAEYHASDHEEAAEDQTKQS